MQVGRTRSEPFDALWSDIEPGPKGVRYIAEVGGRFVLDELEIG